MDGLDDVFSGLYESTADPCDIICEACDDYKGTSSTLEGALVKANMLADTIGMDYLLNCKNIEKKCIMEGGSGDDYAFYESGAREGAIGKLRAVVTKIIQFWKDLCRKTMEIVKSKICTSRAKSSIKGMQKKLALNPQLAKTKVKAPDISSALKIIEKYRNKCDINDAKLIKGITGWMEAKTVADTIAEFNKAFENATVGAAATCVLTVAGILIALEQEIDKLPTYIGNLEASQSAILDRLAASVDDETAVTAMAALQAAENFRIQLGKQEFDVRIKYINDLVAAAKSAISGKAPINMNVMEEGEEDTGEDEIVQEDETVFEEAGEDLDSYLDDEQSVDSFMEEMGWDSLGGEIFEEGATNDIRKDWKKLNKETVKPAMKEIKKLYKEKDYIACAKKIDEVIPVLKKAKKDIRSIDQTTGEAIAGEFLQMFIGMAKYIALSIPTLGIGGAIYLGKTWIRSIGAISENIANNKKITAADWNSYTNQIIGLIDDLIASLNKMKRGCKKNAGSVIQEEFEGEPIQEDEIVFEEDAELDTYLDDLLQSAL